MVALLLAINAHARRPCQHRVQLRVSHLVATAVDKHEHQHQEAVLGLLHLVLLAMLGGKLGRHRLHLRIHHAHQHVLIPRVIVLFQLDAEYAFQLVLCHLHYLLVLATPDAQVLANVVALHNATLVEGVSDNEA